MTRIKSLRQDARPLGQAAGKEPLQGSTNLPDGDQVPQYVAYQDTCSQAEYMLVDLDIAYSR
jgi:hypothetical protein